MWGGLRRLLLWWNELAVLLLSGRAFCAPLASLLQAKAIKCIPVKAKTE